MVDNQNSSTASLVCRVKKVVFHNKVNGYSVLSVISDSEDSQFSICGILNGMPEGSVLRCQGKWKEHIMYGRQFIVDSWEEGKADEVEKLFCIPSRANSRPVYRTWGDFLKNNPDAAEKAKYVTDVFLTNVEKDYDNAESCCEDYTLDVTAEAKATYYAEYNGRKYPLITCTFSMQESFTEDFDDDLNVYEIEALVEDGRLGNYARAHSAFYGVNDFEGLSQLDFHASGVPTCLEELIGNHNQRASAASGESGGEYTIDEIATDVEYAIEKAFSDAGIECFDGEFQCASMFARRKICGEFT